MNRSILDQGWYEMRRQLEYKQFWRVGQVLLYLRHITASGAPAAVIRRKKTVKRKVNSCVRDAVTPRTPISTAQVTYWLQNMPCLPVEGECSLIGNPPTKVRLWPERCRNSRTLVQAGCQNKGCWKNFES